MPRPLPITMGTHWKRIQTTCCRLYSFGATPQVAACQRYVGRLHRMHQQARQVFAGSSSVCFGARETSSRSTHHSLPSYAPVTAYRIHRQYPCGMWSTCDSLRAQTRFSQGISMTRPLSHLPSTVLAQTFASSRDTLSDVARFLGTDPRQQHLITRYCSELESGRNALFHLPQSASATEATRIISRPQPPLPSSAATACYDILRQLLHDLRAPVHGFTKR